MSAIITWGPVKILRDNLLLFRYVHVSSSKRVNGNISSDRPILSHIHGRLIVLEEEVDVAKAVRAMHSQKAELS